MCGRARRVARAERVRRLNSLAVELHVALGERDVAVATFERRAGQALRAMPSNEGLTLREAVDWCGAGLTLRDASRRTDQFGGVPRHQFFPLGIGQTFRIVAWICRTVAVTVHYQPSLQGPGSARPGGACPRYAAGRAADIRSRHWSGRSARYWGGGRRDPAAPRRPGANAVGPAVRHPRHPCSSATRALLEHLSEV